MDRIWQTAPVAALRVMIERDVPRFEINASARGWAAEHGITLAEWQALAQQIQGLADGSSVQAVLGHPAQAVQVQVVVLPGGVLAWLVPDSANGTPPEAVQSARTVRPTQELLTQAVELAAVGVWTFDDQSGLLHLNAEAARLAGLAAEPASVTLDVFYARLHPDDHAASLAAAHRARATDVPVDLVMHMAQADGSAWRTLFTRRVAVRNAQAQAIGVLGVTLDFTELMSMRERAEGLAARSRLVSETIGVGFWTRDLEADTVFWDDQMFRIHGRDPTLGPPGLEAWIEQHVHPADRQRVIARQRSAQAVWEPYTDIVCRAATPDGSEKWVQTWTQRTVRDGRRQSFGMHLDVSARVIAEHVLQRERDRYRFAMEAAGLGVWERDFNTGRSYWNPVMYALRGLDVHDPRPVTELVVACHHPEDQRRMERMAQEHLTNGTPYATELRVRLPDGSTRWLATAGRIVDDPVRGIRLMAGINIDVTERRQAEALREAKRSAEQASRDKSGFLARASHELRTPMNAILGFTELLARDDAASPHEATRRRLAHVNKAARHLMGLIDDILELSALDAAALARPLVALDLRAALLEAIERMAPSAQPAGIRIDNLLHEPALVWADARGLRQVLSNLLSNAIKFNRTGGWVRIEPVHRLQGDKLQAGLSVVDGGVGIPAHQLAAVFQPFERAGAERGPIEGTGLGLAIVRQLMLHMDGTVELRSTAGSGSSFTLWFAAVAQAGREPAAAVAATAQGEAAPGWPDRPFIALCVEDNPVNLQLVCELFALRPAMVLHTAVNGLDGVEQACRLRPDLVLLDMQLPDIDGHEVLRRLRGQVETADIHVVALTADAMPGHVEAALAAGFDDYWTKPIDFGSFLEGLDRIAAQMQSSTADDGHPRQGARRSRSHALPSSR